MEDIHLSKSGMSRKYRMNNGMRDAGELFGVITAVKKGDSSVRMSAYGIGISGKIYDSLNDIIGLNRTKSMV